MVNGVTGLAVTNLDGLDAYATLQICTGYDIKGDHHTLPPADALGMETCRAPSMKPCPAGNATPPAAPATINYRRGRRPISSDSASFAALHRICRSRPGPQANPDSFIGPIVFYDTYL